MPPFVPSCVVLVPSGAVACRPFEDALADLARRGYPVRRGRESVPPPGLRNRLAADALTAGFAEFLWLDPTVAFHPADVERLRAANLPVLCGVYPWSGRPSLVCEFPQGTTGVRFGRHGSQTQVTWCGLGFALVRRAVFEAIATSTGTPPKFFDAPGSTGDPATVLAAEDAAFCLRVHAAGFEVVADTSIRLWRVGAAKLGWEDACGDRERHADFSIRIQTADAPPVGAPTDRSDGQPASPNPPIRPPSVALSVEFPRVCLSVVTYPANAASLEKTLASIRASDWATEPLIVMQPAEWPTSRESGARNYKRALEAAATDGCDFALILEDDVRVNRHLRHNLLANPLIRRDQCDYLGLFLPDLIADPWERREAHLGYRLARPRYSGSSVRWTRNRVWGTQGLLLSRRLVLAALQRWDRFPDGHDTRLLSVCAAFKVPLWYTQPCLVEHAPCVSAFETPDAYAPDFDLEFCLTVGDGFQPPEAIPGELTVEEGELLWRMATGRDVLVLGTAYGQTTVCMAQSARRVVSADAADQSEAMEWVHRFGVANQVEFRQGNESAVCRGLGGRFGLVLLDTPHDAVTIERDVAAALRVLKPGGLLAFRAYPDPVWPDVRRVVDAHASRLGWRRLAQEGFLGVFRT
ncbi:MAG: class I SAM-dependent methyltransferase [Planctomycetes bacterium]|nr:class I SAM-dependent methyltransferase [Planctomycetota bacterium]